jgi:type IV pilus assembly protein PilN
MIQINLIRDRKLERVPGSKPAGAGFSLPRLPFNVGILASVLGVVVIIAAVVLIFLSQRAQITGLNTKIKGYQEELSKLAGPKRMVDEFEAKKQEVKTKLDEITAIDKDRFNAVKLLDQLSRAMPEYLWLISVKEEKNGISMEGMTFSNLIVADFMDRLKESGYFTGVELTQTSKAVSEGRELVKFGISTKYNPNPSNAVVAAEMADQTAGKGSK